jgi:AIPR protein.
MEKKREEILLKLIKQLDYENIDDEKFKTQAKKAFKAPDTNVKVISRIDVSDIVEMDQSDKYFFIVYDPTNQKSDEDIINAIRGSIETLRLPEECTVHLIEIFDSKRNSSHKNSGNRVKELRNSLKGLLLEKKVVDSRSLSMKFIKYSNYAIPKAFEKQSEITIKINDRIRSLEQKCEFGKYSLTGYVFTAEIDSLIDLYDKFGDELFAKNVRVGGVTDSVGVEDDIKRTYRDSPEEFWFLNNGISLLLVTEDDLNLDVYDRVKIPIDTLKDISIINGAQSISAVSEAKYSNTITDQKTPYVLLRIYHYIDSEVSADNNEEQDKRNLEKFSEKVTLSLNKQKPIKRTDLAYVTDFTSNLNEISHVLMLDDKNKKFAFNFVRNGELESLILCQYYIGKFAKVVKAYLAQSPGVARNTSYNSLLKTDNAGDGTIHLDRKEVFLEGFQESNVEDVDSLTDEFLKSYSPVNFAMKLADYLDGNKKYKKIIDTLNSKYDKQFDAELSSFSKYGNLVMLAAIIHLINDFKADFTDWKYSDIAWGSTAEGNELTEDELTEAELEKKVKKVLEAFIATCSERTDRNFIDSNEWKNDDIFNFIMDHLKKSEEKEE